MIIRELVTRLGFSFDRTNLDKFERSIVGFKTKATIAVGLIGTAFKKTLDFATDFSDKILKSSALAKFSKSTIEEVQALENVFKNFNISPEVFQNFFGKLSLGIKEASRGVDSEFRKLVTQSQGAVRLYVDGQLTTSKQAIEDIFSYIKTLSDESEKIRIVQNIFGVDLATADAIIDLANLTKNEFDILIEKEKQSIGQLDNATEAAKKFKSQVNELNTEWGKLTDTLAKALVPVLAQVLGGFNAIIEDTKSLGFVKTAKNIGSTIGEIFDFSSLFHNEAELENMKMNVQRIKEQNIQSAVEIERQKIHNQNSNTISNNNKFEFNVPPGTTEQQANFMSEQVKSTLNTFWDEKTREIINNNPQVE